MRERDIEKYLCKQVAALGGFTEKFTANSRGVPDRICYLPNGVILHVEVKAPNGKPSLLQIKWAEKARALGTPVRYVYSKEDVDRLLQAY